MIKYIVLFAIVGVLVTVAYKKEQQAFDRCLLKGSKNTCFTQLAGG